MLQFRLCTTAMPQRSRPSRSKYTFHMLIPPEEPTFRWPGVQSGVEDSSQCCGNFPHAKQIDISCSTRKLPALVQHRQRTVACYQRTPSIYELINTQRPLQIIRSRAIRNFIANHIYTTTANYGNTRILGAKIKANNRHSVTRNSKTGVAQSIRIQCKQASRRFHRLLGRPLIAAYGCLSPPVTS